MSIAFGSEPFCANAFDNLVSWSFRSSHSTGTAVRSVGTTAPSANSGPVVYAGVSCTNRPLITLGVTMTAFAPAGTGWS